MCRSQNSGENPRRCPCHSADKRSAYERGKRAVVRGQNAVEHEELGRDIEELEESELPYLEEAQVLADDIAAMYFVQKTLRMELGEDPEKLEAVEERQKENPSTQIDRIDALVRLGYLVSRRAEELAGITAETIIANEEKYRLDDMIAYQDVLNESKVVNEEMKELYSERKVVLAEQGISSELQAIDDRINILRDSLNEITKRSDEASNMVHRIGINPNIEKELARLADGYTQALSEIRPMGGTMLWNNAGNTPVVKMFNSAAQVYPADWIEYSNRGLLPFARNLKTRAHYAHFYEKVTKRVHVDYTVERRFPSEEIPEDTLFKTWTVLPPEKSQSFDAAEGFTIWQSQMWEVADAYAKLKADGTPKGAGWQKITWQGAEKELTGWRRKMKIALPDLLESVSAPEIITNLNDKAESRLRNGFSTAVHELSHRYEAMVPEVLKMEEDFHDYRTTNPETGESNPEIRLSATRSKNGKLYDIETGREGGYIAKYMGRDYGGEAFELMSCGMEALFGFNYGGLIGVGKSAKDPQMRAFVLGVLASAGRKYSL